MKTKIIIINYQLTNTMFSYEEINEEWCEYFVQKMIELNINWSNIHINSNITYKYVTSNPDKYWSYYLLSYNQNITQEIVDANINKPWDKNGLDENLNIIWKLRQKNKTKFDIRIFSEDPNINRRLIQENPIQKLDWEQISKCSSITWEIIKENMNKPWNWYLVSQNPNISLEIIQSNPQIPFNIYINPNITFEYIKSLKSITWYNEFVLGMNTFELEKDLFFRKKLRQWFKKSELKEELISKLWHPKNFEKFKYYDPEMFENENNENEI